MVPLPKWCMAVHFNHYSQNGSSPFERISAEFPSVRTAGELIAAGFTSVRGVLAEYMW